MIITLFFVALIGIGIWRHFSDDEGWTPGIIGGFGLAICLCVILFNNVIGGQNNVILYHQDKAKIEAAINNSRLTGEERSAAIDLAIQDNGIILMARKWHKDPFIGWFRQQAIVDLPLFDIETIPHAITAVEVK